MKSVTIYATSQCNLRCKHCGVGPDQESPRKALSTDDLRHVLTEVASAGTRAVTILGGEVTKYRDDMGELLDHAATVGVAVSINTNLTDYDAVAPLLGKPALRSLIVSLDGATAATHDHLRGRGTFERTTANIRRVAPHSRVATRELLIQVAFVMSRVNVHETADMLNLARTLGATHLNVKNVKLFGRAAAYADTLALDPRQLLSAYTLLVVSWMLVRDLELEVFVTPAFATYLNRRFGLQFPTAEHHACGGADVFSYVDLKGNHLPCPAMAYEENLRPAADARSEELSLLSRRVEDTLVSPTFAAFEENRVKRNYMHRMHPCRHCRFAGECVPCVAELIKGKAEDVVDICSAIYEYGDEDLPGIQAEIWRSTSH